MRHPEPESAQREPSQAVFFLASDGVYDWTVALLASFRKFNPTLKLTMIPFSEDIAKLRALADVYEFDVLPEERVAHYDDLGRHFTDRSAQIRMFRKLVVFEGEFDQIVYFDSDVLVLSDLEKLYQGMTGERSIYYYDDDDVFDFVYPDLALARRMKAEHSSVAFNAGTFGYSGTAIEGDELRYATRCADEMKAGVWSDGWDQVFINILADVLDIPKRSFRSIYQRSVEINPGQVRKLIPGVHGCVGEQAQGRVLVPLLHYAGCSLDAVLPHAGLWLGYRNLSQPPLSHYHLACRTDWRAVSKSWLRQALRKAIGWAKV